MKEKLIRKMFFFNGFELGAVEEFLEEMALNGFMFQKQRGMFFYFKECEPKKLRFSVDVFKKASIFDTRPEPVTQEYIEYCQECGWHFLYTSGKLQIFYSEMENPIPIHTDDRERFNLINKQTFWTNGISWLTILFGCLYFLIFVLLGKFAESLIMLGNIILFYLVVLLVMAGDIVRYLIFYFKNKKCIAQNKGLWFYSKSNTVKNQCFRMVFLIVVFFAFMISIWKNTGFGFTVMAVVIVLDIAIAFFEVNRQGNKKLSRVDNIAITLAVTVLAAGGCMVISLGGILATLFFGDNSEVVKYYDETEGIYVIQSIEHDEIPVTLEYLGVDVKEVKYTDSSCTTYNSVFGTYDIYGQYLYTDKMDAYGYVEYGDKARVVHYENQLLYISTDTFEFTQDVIEKIVDTMK